MRTDKKPLSCEEARDLMFDYLDNNLTPSRTERLLAHLAACADCRAELDERREMLALIADVAEEPPAALHDNIMRAIADIPQDAPGSGAKILTDQKRRFIPWGTVAAACAAVMILVAGRGMLPGTGAGDIVSPAADRLALVLCKRGKISRGSRKPHAPFSFILYLLYRLINFFQANRRFLKRRSAT